MKEQAYLKSIKGNTALIERACACSVCPEDVREIEAFYSVPARDVLKESIDSATLVYGLFCGEKIWGVAGLTLGEEVNYPWLLTDGTTKNSVGAVFLRKSKIVIEEMLSFGKPLENYTAIDNSKAIAWLQWLGFEFDYDTGVFSRNGVTFVRFSRAGIPLS